MPAALVKPNPKDPTRRSLINLVIDWINFLNGSIAAAPTTVVNGSFEQYSGSSNVPDNWGFTPYTGGSGAIDSSVGNQSDGLRGFKIVVPGGGGNGGGYIESYTGAIGQLVPFSNLEDFWASWYYKTSVATVTNLVEVRWYDKASAFISASTLWSASSGQPSAWTQNVGTIPTASIPATARFYSIRLTGGSVNSDAGNVWYDEVKSGFQPQFSGRSTTYSTAGSFTFTPPPNCFRVQLKMWGGGGGGATGGAHGGGGGGYAEGFLNVSPATSYTVTVGAAGVSGGAGGNTAFTGGPSPNGGGAGTVPAPGAGGTSTGGYLNIVGQPGDPCGSLCGGNSPQGGSGASLVGGNGAVAPGGGGAGSAIAGLKLGAAGKVVVLY